MQLGIMEILPNMYVIIYYIQITHSIYILLIIIYIYNIANIPFGEDFEQKSNSAKKLYDVINKILETYTN